MVQVCISAHGVTTPTSTICFSLPLTFLLLLQWFSYLGLGHRTSAVTMVHMITTTITHTITTWHDNYMGPSFWLGTLASYYNESSNTDHYSCYDYNSQNAYMAWQQHWSNFLTRHMGLLRLQQPQIWCLLKLILHGLTATLVQPSDSTLGCIGTPTSLISITVPPLLTILRVQQQ